MQDAAVLRQRAKVQLVFDAELVAGLRSVDRIDRATCREHVRRNFSVERMVEGYLRVYEQRIALSSPRSRGLPNRACATLVSGA